MVKGWLQKKLINLLARHLFNSVSFDDILSVRKDGIWLNGRKLSDADVKQIKSEAGALKRFLLWGLLNNELKLAANMRMFEKSQTVEDIVAGKLLLYQVNVQKEIVERISDL